MPKTASVGPATGSRRVIVAASLVSFIEGYDALLFGYFATILSEQFFPGGDSTAALLNTFAIFAVGFAMRPLGAILFGYVGDGFGRVHALISSVLVMVVATLGIGLLPTYQAVGAWAPALLLACRLLQGLSVGGEYVGANILILEHAPEGRSGRWVSANLVGGYLGISAAGAAGLVLAKVLSPADLTAWGWRLPFFAAVPLAVVALYMRLHITDGPAFTAARERRRDFPLGAVFRLASRGMLAFAAWFAMAGLGAYLLIGYLASYLTKVVGMTQAEAFAANLVAVLTLTVGALSGGYLVDRYSPRTVGVFCACGVALVAVPGFLVVQRGTMATTILGQIPLAFCLGIAGTVGAALSVSLFPAEVRYTAAGFAYSVASTLFGSSAPYVSTWLIARTGSPTAPAWYLEGMAVVGVTVAMLMLGPQAEGS